MPTPRSQKFSFLCFLLVLGFIFRSIIYFESIFLYSVRCGLRFFFFFHMWISNCPSTNCWKDYPFPTKCLCSFLEKSVVHTCASLFLKSLLFHWTFCLVLMPVSYCLDYHIFISLGVRLCKSTEFVLFRSCGLFWVLKDFRRGLSISTEELCWDFDGDCVKSINQLLLCI